MFIRRVLISVLAASTSACAAAEPDAEAPGIAPWAVTERELPDGWTFPPSFSPDGQTAWVVQWKDPLNVDRPQRLHRFDRTEDGWSAPTAFDLAPGQFLDWPSVTPDGAALLISIGARGEQDGTVTADFDIFRIALPLARNTLEPFGGPLVNQPKTAENATIGYVNNETGPLLLADGTLVFWTERAGATGRRDIFFAAAGEGGGFAPPTEFAHNWKGNDAAPWLPPGGALMLFTSDRPGGSGGSDIWLSRRGDDGWSQPCPLPEPINSRFDEGSPEVDPLTGDLFLSSLRPLPDGAEDGRYRTWRVPAAELSCRD